MKRISVISAQALALARSRLAAAAGSAQAAGGDGPEYVRQPWTFAGFRGLLRSSQLQRGFLVYKEVCASCHSLKRMSFRNLAEAGGPGYSEEQAKSAAAEWLHQIPEPNERRYRRPQGQYHHPRGQGVRPDPRARSRTSAGARAPTTRRLPPDLSVIVKARGIEVDRPFYARPRRHAARYRHRAIRKPVPTTSMPC